MPETPADTPDLLALLTLLTEQQDTYKVEVVRILRARRVSWKVIADAMGYGTAWSASNWFKTQQGKRLPPG